MLRPISFMTCFDCSLVYTLDFKLNVMTLDDLAFDTLDRAGLSKEKVDKTSYNNIIMFIILL